MDGVKLPTWQRDFFVKLSQAGLGVHLASFVHQIEDLKAASVGRDLFVATGTGSGKTECFMWPLLRKMTAEVHDSAKTWAVRGVRTVIMYPMNALVSDQVGRLRRLISDAESKFVKIFRDTCGKDARRPQFGMYTGRTPYPGEMSQSSQDRMLEKHSKEFHFHSCLRSKNISIRLQRNALIPAKADMSAFLQRLHDGRHAPDSEDAELITHFEIQQFCPDILITNYSMLEYMLFRPMVCGTMRKCRGWWSPSVPAVPPLPERRGIGLNDNY